MGWERRGNKFYFYTKSRSLGKVSSIYQGHNRKSLEIQSYELLAQCRKLNVLRHLEALEEKKLLKVEKQKADKKFKREIQEYKQACNAANQALAAINKLIKVALLANGFHQHKGTWRKSRNPKAIERKENNVRTTT